jgi:flagellar basal-body rod protein FlgF
LTNGAGAQMLDLNQAPIAVPPFRKLIVSETGEMFIEPLGSDEGTRVALGTLATTSGSETPMKKDIDGEIRLVGGGVPAPDQNSTIAQSFLEESNVNAVEELVDTLSQQRQFEINVKFISLSKDMDEGSAGLMRMPN